MRRIAVPLELTRAAAAPREGRPVSLYGPTMGVSWTLTAHAPPGISDDVLNETVQTCANTVVAQMSGWEPDSDLSRFNRAPAGWVAAGPELLTVVAAGLEIAELSGGAFDPTLGDLVDRWGFGPAGAVHEPPAGPSRALGRWRELRIDRDAGRLWQPGGLSLDLSGIAKGFAVDLAGCALEALGVRDHLLEIGGELRGSGVKPGGEPWWVEIEAHPDEAGVEPPILVALHGLSIATSGDWRRGFTAGGRRYSHTLDPRTGAPLPNALAAVSVLHADCMMADAFCTALMVLGDEALAFATDHGIAARLLHRQGDGFRETLSPALEALLT